MLYKSNKVISKEFLNSIQMTIDCDDETIYRENKKVLLI